MENKITANGVTFYQDWDKYSGSIVMVKPKTISRYRYLTEGEAAHPKTDDYGVFFSFSKDSFEKEYKRLVQQGYINEGEKIINAGQGLFGTKQELGRYLEFYTKRNEIIKQECNPQEAYCYEFNNHECMITGDDEPALTVVAERFGNAAARSIRRVCAYIPIHLIAPLGEREEHLKEYNHTILMIRRLVFDIDGFLAPGDCRYKRESDLYCKNADKQIAKLRQMADSLPDDIKDNAPSKEEIDQYERIMKDLLDEKDCKPVETEDAEL